jgi:hypothetical protein
MLFFATAWVDDPIGGRLMSMALSSSSVGGFSITFTSWLSCDLVTGWPSLVHQFSVNSTSIQKAASSTESLTHLSIICPRAPEGGLVRSGLGSAAAFRHGSSLSRGVHSIPPVPDLIHAAVLNWFYTSCEFWWSTFPTSGLNEEVGRALATDHVKIAVYSCL